MGNALQMNWQGIRHFKAKEWPEGALEHMDSRLILSLDMLRRQLPRDHSLIPSPILEGHVRPLAGTRHSILNDRLSDASDLFARWDTVWAIWTEAQRHGFGGIGVYIDTWLDDPGVTRPMLHFDLRDERLLWVKTGQTYFYLHDNPRGFFRVLSSYVRRR